MDKKLSKNLKYILPLFAVFLVGLILRFYLLGQVPISIHRDEAFQGYNAYSILKTGSDISGIFLPIHLESFFYSPAGYSYLSIPFIALFGLSEFSIRFASAILGSLTIILVYLISLSLFKEKKEKYQVAILSSLFLAIMPWHINLSRVVGESTAVVFFISLGIYFYLKYLEKKKWILFVLSLIFFGVNFFIYQAPRVFLPLFLPLLAFSLTDLRNIPRNKFQIVLFLILIILPLSFILLSPTLSLRIQSLSIFNHPETKLVIQEQLMNDGVLNLPGLVSRAIHNKITSYTLLFVNNYFSHFSFDFLFSDGAFPDRFRIPGMGLLYIFQLPLVIISFLLLYIKNKKIGLLLFGWIGIAMLGSALTYDDIPNMQRTFIAVPAIAIISGYGLSELITKFRKKKFFWPASLVFLLIIIYSFSYFLVQYFGQSKVYMTWYKQDGYSELVKVTNEISPRYEKAVITSRETAPTILFLFYSKYDPKRFQEETSEIDMKNSDHVSFSKFEFTDEECPLRIDEVSGKITGKKGTLYVNSALCKKDIPGADLLHVVRRFGGLSEVFRVYEVK